MSVVVGKRSKGKLKVLALASELTTYTLKVCKNEKIFPKSYRWLLTQKLVNETIEAMNCIRRANAMQLPTEDDEANRQAYNFRLAQQKKAYACYEAVLGMLDIAYNVLSIESRRVEYWTGLIVDVEEKLKAWMKSDKQRVDKIFKD